MKMKSQPTTVWALVGLMVAVLVWGAVLATGAYLSGFDIRKGLIVSVCVFGFLGSWIVLLLIRRWNPPVAKSDPPAKPPAAEKPHF